jgi:hypothetical protein
MTKNVLYCYHGSKYEAEALLSMQKLSVRDPDVNIWAIAPSKPNFSGVQFKQEVASSENSGYAYKVSAITSFDQRQFVFLDTDTHTVSSIQELYDVLPDIGIAGVTDPLLDTFKHVPGLNRPAFWSSQRAYMSELNSGVLLVNLDRLPVEFMQVWQTRHDELCAANPQMKKGGVPDQPSLRQAIVDCGVTPFLLGNEFNFRPCYPQTLYRAARIVHIHLDAKTSHVDGAGCDGEIVSTYPWGGAIGRTSLLNRGLFFAKRAITRIK